MSAFKSGDLGSILGGVIPKIWRLILAASFSLLEYENVIKVICTVYLYDVISFRKNTKAESGSLRTS